MLSMSLANEGSTGDGGATRAGEEATLGRAAPDGDFSLDGGGGKASRLGGAASSEGQEAQLCSSGRFSFFLLKTKKIYR
jgi:hypothetical protein